MIIRSKRSAQPLNITLGVLVSCWSSKPEWNLVRTMTRSGNYNMSLCAGYQEIYIREYPEAGNRTTVLRPAGQAER